MNRWGAVLLGIAVLMLTAGPASATPVTDPAAVDEGFSFKTLIFILLGVLALIIVSSLGPLSRMAERREELRREELAEKNPAVKNPAVKNPAEKPDKPELNL